MMSGDELARVLEERHRDRGLIRHVARRLERRKPQA